MHIVYQIFKNCQVIRELCDKQKNGTQFNICVEQILKSIYWSIGMEGLYLNKELNRIEKLAREKAKQDKCLLCGKKMSSYCNSHSIPRYILKNISEQGFVNDLSLILEMPNTKKNLGTKEAGTFNNICSDCDQKWFKDYEEPDKLLDENLSDKLLAEIALKNVTQMIYKRHYEKELCKLYSEDFPDDMLKLVVSWKNWDIRDYKQRLEIYKRIIENDEKGSFNIIYKKVLPYQTKIAAQSAIAINDYNNRQINDVFSEKELTDIQIMHICVFPLKSETLLLLFYHKADKKYRDIMHDFNSHSDEYKIDMFNYFVFANIENFYFSPAIGSIFVENDKLKYLCMEQYQLPILNKEYSTYNMEDYTPIEYNEIPNVLNIK